MLNCLVLTTLRMDDVAVVVAAVANISAPVRRHALVGAPKNGKGHRYAWIRGFRWVPEERKVQTDYLSSENLNGIVADAIERNRIPTILSDPLKRLKERASA